MIVKNKLGRSCKALCLPCALPAAYYSSMMSTAFAGACNVHAVACYVIAAAGCCNPGPCRQYSDAVDAEQLVPVMSSIRRPVVTAFVRNADGKLLVVRRSHQVRHSAWCCSSYMLQ